MECRTQVRWYSRTRKIVRKITTGPVESKLYVHLDDPAATSLPSPRSQMSLATLPTKSRNSRSRKITWRKWKGKLQNLAVNSLTTTVIAQSPLMEM